MQIYVDIEGTDELQRKLAQMIARGKNLKPPLRDVANVVLMGVNKNFEAEGRPNRWAPRSPKTLLSMQAQEVGRATETRRFQRAGSRARDNIIRQTIIRASGYKILQVKGDLRKSITAAVSDTEVRVGSSLPYARIHQLGGTIGSVVIRPRNKKALAFLVSAGHQVIVKSVTRPAIRIPARPYLVIQPDEKQQIVRILEDWVIGDG